MSTAAWYPAEPAARRRAITGDAIVAALLVVFAVFAFSIHDAVGDLGRMGSDIRAAGETLRDSGRATAGDIRDAFGGTADLPLVGDLASPLRDAGDRLAGSLEKQTVATGQNLADSGRQGEADARRIAMLAGWVTFLIPSVLLLALTLPPRLRQIRELRT